MTFQGASFSLCEVYLASHANGSSFVPALFCVGLLANLGASISAKAKVLSGGGLEREEKGDILETRVLNINVPRRENQYKTTFNMCVYLGLGGGMTKVERDILLRIVSQ